MKKLFILFALISVHAFPQSDIPVSNNFTWNGEISIAVNPNDPSNLVAAWMKLTTFTIVTIGISHSNDYGNTWSNPVYMPHFSNSYTSADPTLITSSDGTFYFAYIDFNGTTNASGGVFVTHSSDGGDSWSTPAQAIDASFAPDIPIDRPWLAIDNSNGPYNGKLYLVTKSIKEATMTHHIYIIRSNDHGLSWDTPRILDNVLPVGGTANTMGVPCVSSNGSLYVNYLSFDISLSLYVRDVFMRSNDGGQTFIPGIIANLPYTSVIPPADSLFQYSYHIASNPADSNNLIHLITDRRDGDWDIWYNVSQDGGNTWSATSRLNDDPIGNGIGQDMCWGGFSSNGSYAALWRDRRDGSGGQTSDYRIYGTLSLDKGLSFSPNFALSQTLAPLTVPVTGNDFLGTCLSDSLINGVWSDKRTGLNQEYFNKRSFQSVSGTQNLTNAKDPWIIPSVIQSGFADINSVLLKENPSYTINIYDLPGRIVLHQSNNFHIVLSSLPRGMYILCFISGTRRIYQRFILE